MGKERNTSNNSSKWLTSKDNHLWCTEPLSNLGQTHTPIFPHQKTIIFGALSHDGRQLFRQYDKFDQYCFLDYLKELNRKFGKILVYADRAPQHKSKLIQKYLDDTPDVMLHWFPKGSPQFNAVEEVWKQGKYNLLVSQYQPSLSNLKNNISKYYRTRRFNLDILKYMQREDG